MSSSVTDKFGNLHVFVREDFKHPAFVKAVLTPDQVLKINQPTHVIPANETVLGQRIAAGEDVGKEPVDVPSWRVVSDGQRVVLPDLKYGYIQIVDASHPLSTLLLWFDSAEEATAAEEAHG